MVIESQLKQADIFFGLSEEQLSRIASICSRKSYRRGETIFNENTQGEHLFLIARGEVNIIVDPALVDEGQRSGTKPQAIATLRRGQSFGELALVDEGIRSASAQCTSAKADLLLIPRTELLDLCDMDRDLGYKLMRNIASDLATKLRTTDLLVRDQLLRKSPESTHKDR